MTVSPEELIKQMAAEADSSADALRALNGKLRGYLDRLDVICMQYRHKTPIKDSTFQEEFRATMLELKEFTDKSNDFWQKNRACLREMDKAKLVENGKTALKQLNIAASAFTKQAEDLSKIFGYTQALAKNVPLRLNWWLLGDSCEDLTKITSRILFMIRDTEKYL